MQLSLHTTRFDQDVLILEELPMPDLVEFKRWLLNKHIQPFFDAKDIEAVGYDLYVEWAIERTKQATANKK